VTRAALGCEGLCSCTYSCTRVLVHSFSGVSFPAKPNQSRCWRPSTSVLLPSSVSPASPPCPESQPQPRTQPRPSGYSSSTPTRPPPSPPPSPLHCPRALPGGALTFHNPSTGPPGIHDATTAQQSTEACLSELTGASPTLELEKFDGVLVSCFSEHPLIPALSSHLD
jgi:hypothetical protein